MHKAMTFFKTVDIRQLRIEVPEIKETNKKNLRIVPLTDLRMLPKTGRESLSKRCLELPDCGE